MVNVDATIQNLAKNVFVRGKIECLEFVTEGEVEVTIGLSVGAKAVMTGVC